MKETLHKRIFYPIWKCNEVEKQLSKLESAGWKLHKISGFHKFTFVKSSPKESTYFFTYAFAKEAGMITTDGLLKQQHKANKIPGNFIEGLKTTSVYRMMGSPDLAQRSIYRNRYLSHLVSQYILIGLFCLILSIAGLVASCTFDGRPFWDIANIIFFVAGVYGAVTFSYHLFGWFHLQKEYGNCFVLDQD